MLTMTRRRWIVAAIALIVLAGLASAGALFFIDEPLRRYSEAKMNARLKGYTATIGALHFSPINFTFELRDTVIVQHEHPNPPVANVGRLYASVHWRALLAGRVVGDIIIDRPVVVLDLPQAKEEITDPTPVKDKGWQDALQAIYPLKINQLKSRRATSPTGTTGPSSLCASRTSRWRLQYPQRALRRGSLPSPMASPRACSTAGRHRHRMGRLPRRASRRFMTDIKLDRIELDYLKPITRRYNVTMDQGTLSAYGELEIAPQYKSVTCGRHREGPRRLPPHPEDGGGGQGGGAGGHEGGRQAPGPGTDVRVDRLEIVRSNFGFVNKTVSSELSRVRERHRR